MGDRYTPWAVEIVPDGGSSQIIGGVTAQNVDTGAQVNAEVNAGLASPQYGEIGTLQSAGSFTAHDITKVLTAIGTRGACLDGGASPGFAIWTLKKNDCGDLATGSVHRKVIIPNGRIVPTTLNAQQGSRASITCSVMSLYDGTNDPIIILENQAAPTGIVDNVGFHMGAIQLAGVTLERNSNFSIDFGNTITPEYDDGEVFAQSLHIDQVQPTLSVTTHDVSKFGDGASQIPLRGKAATHANTSIFLRKRVLGTGSFDAGDVHIEFNAAGVVTVGNTSATGNSPHAMDVSLTSLDDTTNDMLAYDGEASLP